MKFMIYEVVFWQHESLLKYKKKKKSEKGEMYMRVCKFRELHVCGKTG